MSPCALVYEKSINWQCLMAYLFNLHSSMYIVLSEESCLICFQKSASYHFECFNWELHYNFVQLNTINAFICPYRKLSLYLGIVCRRRRQNYTLPWEVWFTKFKTALQKWKIPVLVYTPQIMKLGSAEFNNYVFDSYTNTSFCSTGGLWIICRAQPRRNYTFWYTCSFGSEEGYVW